MNDTSRPAKRGVAPASQRGYVNLDGIVPILIGFGIVCGLVIYAVVSWLWPIVKGWIHQVTA